MLSKVSVAVLQPNSGRKLCEMLDLIINFCKNTPKHTPIPIQWEREKMICLRGAATSSSAWHEVPRSSLPVRSITTPNCARSQEGEAARSYCTVAMSAACSCRPIRLPHVPDFGHINVSQQ